MNSMYGKKVKAMKENGKWVEGIVSSDDAHIFMLVVVHEPGKDYTWAVTHNVYRHNAVEIA